MASPAPRAQLAIGDTTVTYLPDGYGWLDPYAVFPASAPHGWDTHRDQLDDTGRFPVSIGSFLIRAGGRVILVDLGIGAVDFEVPGLARFHGGRLLDSLAAEGLRPNQVDTVVFTHLHHDHVGWTSNLAPAPNAPGGQRLTGLTFAHARHLASAAEWRHWAGTAELVGPDPIAVQRPLASRLEHLAGEQAVAPGVHALATPGHTPGHLSLLVTDPTGHDPRRALILGDVMHTPVQVGEPSWNWAFDGDADLARQTREQVLKTAVHEPTILVEGHFPGSVFGRVHPATPGRRWVPSPGG